MSSRLWSSAPVGQAFTQGMSSHISQGTSRATKYGVPVVTGSSNFASFRVSKGQSRTHKPQRIQAPKNLSSLIAPGGLNICEGNEADCREYIPIPRPNSATPVAVLAESTRNRLLLEELGALRFLFSLCTECWVVMLPMFLIRLLYYALTTLTAHFL